MVRYENDCCGCASEGYPCIGSSCPLRHVPHLFCDGCPSEEETLFSIDEYEFCRSCLSEYLAEQYGVVGNDEAEVERMIAEDLITVLRAEEVER